MGKAVAAWLGPTGDAARRLVTEWRERVSSEPRKLELYFDIADPWSYLAAQAAQRLLAAYPVEFGIHIVTPPAGDVDPQPQLRANYAVRDAQYLAAYWDLDFEGTRQADPAAVREVGTALIRPRPAREQLQCALELSAALWRNDRKQIAKLLGTWGAESHTAVPPVLHSQYAALRKAGHYTGATFHYGSEWYWGIDRLHFLETQLANDVGVKVANVVSPRPEAQRGAMAIAEPQPNKPLPDLACEMWMSFGSPACYLAIEQIEAVLAPYQVPLVLRPVPATMGTSATMPTEQKLYILRDAKRLADQLGIPFGEICDPAGPGVEHCIALAHWAHQRGRLLPFARSAMKAAWSEARDLTDYVDLRYVVERADLPWAEAREVLHNPEAAQWAQANASDLAVFGLWDVPSFKVGDFAAWGTDRLPLVADRLRPHLAVTPEARRP